MLSAGPDLFPQAILSRSPELVFDRIVGLESSPGGMDFLVASCDGSRTVIELWPYKEKSQFVGERKALVVLDGVHDVVQASSNTRRDFVFFTEACDSTGSSVKYLGQRSELVNTKLAQYSSSPELASRSRLSEVEFQPNSFCCLAGKLMPVSSRHYSTYTAAYCCPQSPGNSLFAIQARDFHSVRVLKVVRNQQQKTFEISAAKALVTDLVWHQWDPFTRLFSCAAVQQGERDPIIRVYEFPPGKKEAIVFQLHEGRNKFDCRGNHLSFMGQPEPWGAANCTPNSHINMALLPIMYECEKKDYALCQQIIPKAKEIRDICISITLTRVLRIHEVTLTLEESIPVEQARVTFLFKYGMILCLIPGMVVHFIDVHHRDQPPQSLFTVPYPFRQLRVVHLPVPFFSLLLVPNTLQVFSVELSQESLWGCICQQLEACSENNSLGAGHKETEEVLCRALHCATTHFIDKEKAQKKFNGTPTFLKRIICKDFRLATPRVLQASLLGDAYLRARSICKARKIEFWSVLPMSVDPILDISLSAHSPCQASSRFEASCWSMSPERESEPTIGGANTVIGTKVRRPMRIPRNSNSLHNMDQAWFLDDGFDGGNSLRFWRRKEGFRSVRISLADTRGKVSNTNNETMSQKLQSFGVPAEESGKVAEAYFQSMGDALNEMLNVFESESLDISVQLHLFHTISYALAELGILRPQWFVEKFSCVAARNLTHRVFLEGCHSGLYKLKTEDATELFGCRTSASADAAYGVMQQSLSASKSRIFSDFFVNSSQMDNYFTTNMLLMTRGSETAKRRAVSRYFPSTMVLWKTHDTLGTLDSPIVGFSPLESFFACCRPKAQSTLAKMRQSFKFKGSRPSKEEMEAEEEKRAAIESCLMFCYSPFDTSCYSAFQKQLYSQ